MLNLRTDRQSGKSDGDPDARTHEIRRVMREIRFGRGAAQYCEFLDLWPQKAAIFDILGL